MVVEVMGRYAGWIALYAGVAGGADVILIPEIPFDLNLVAARLREREAWGARFSIVVVAEGAVPIGGKVSLIAEGDAAGTSSGSAGSARSVARAAREADRQRDPLCRARPPAARRHADELRPRPGHTVWRQGCRVRPSRRVRRDGRVRPPDIVTVPLDEVVGKTEARAARTST